MNLKKKKKNSGDFLEDTVMPLLSKFDFKWSHGSFAGGSIEIR